MGLTPDLESEGVSTVAGVECFCKGWVLCSGVTLSALLGRDSVPWEQAAGPSKGKAGTTHQANSVVEETELPSFPFSKYIVKTQHIPELACWQGF